jgi:hypothetical protein
MTPDELSERLWLFAARAGKVVDALPNTRLGRQVAGQLVRCGTSVEHSGSFNSHSEIEASAAPRSTLFGLGLKCPIFN